VGGCAAREDALALTPGMKKKLENALPETRRRNNRVSSSAFSSFFFMPGVSARGVPFERRLP